MVAPLPDRGRDSGGDMWISYLLGVSLEKKGFSDGHLTIVGLKVRIHDVKY
jgi:hypothetical protein